jgi:cell division protein FtsI (penicillin-binding protein 3)
MWSGLAFLAIFAGFVIARLVQVQLVQPERWDKRARKQYRAVIRRRAPRGRVLDRNGNLLAGNRERPTVIADLRALEDPIATADALAPVLRIFASQIHSRLTLDRHVVYLKRHVDRKTVQELQELGLPGIGLEMEPGRVYPNGTLAAHVVGYTNIDNIGSSGIEMKLEKYLRGDEYTYQVSRDGRMRVLQTWNLSEANPNQGLDVVLTLDSGIQHAVEDALADVCTEEKATGGAAIVLDVPTGEILALASYPSFDPNFYNKGYTENDHFNRATGFLYEPGSVIKVATFLAALAENRITPEMVFDIGRGYYRVCNHTYRELHFWKPRLTATEVLLRSSNVGTIMIGERVGADALCNRFDEFGFSKIPCPDLVCEKQRGPNLESPGWSCLSLASISFRGGEMLVSPMGLAAVFNTVANNGVYVTPHVVRYLEGTMNQTRQPHTKVETRRIVSEDTARTLRQMMVQVTEHPRATGKRARVAGFHIAGKTGTALKWDSELGRYSDSRIVTTFGGILPAGDPRVTILVMVDEPKENDQAGLVLGPPFVRIAEAVVNQLGIPQDEVETPGSEGTPERFVEAAAIPAGEVHAASMPDLSGRTIAEAVSQLASREILPQVEGTARLERQEPPAGAPLNPSGTRLVFAVPEHGEVENEVEERGSQ